MTETLVKTLPKINTQYDKFLKSSELDIHKNQNYLIKLVSLLYRIYYI